LSAAADVDVDGQLGIASDLRSSFDSARAGLLVYANAAKALRGFVQAMVDMNPGMPSDLTYGGNGVYTAHPNPDTTVEIRFYLTAATSFGNAGDLIAFNLFSVDNYFTSFGVKTSMSASLSGITTSTSFTFDGLGKGAELLGIASSAQGSVPVDVNGYTKQLSNVIIHASVGVAHAAQNAHIAFTMAPASRTVAAVDDGAIALGISGFEGQGQAFGQTIVLESSSLSMRNSGSAYDGALRFGVASADFDFQIRFSYAASASATVEFGCPGTLE
jgi:hypothetical protein